jgi:HEAT repeat protein
MWQRQTAPASLGVHTTKLAKAAPRIERAAKPLAELIASKDLWNATTALEHAKRRPPREAIAELVHILAGDGPSAERANAMWIASAVASPEDGPILARYLNDPSSDVRRMAFEAVKRTGYSDAIPTLAAIVCASVHDNQAEGVFAATAMKSLSGKRGASGLLSYFASDDPRVREAACHAFMMFDDGHKLALPYLEKAATDNDPAVAAAARRTLMKLAKGA